MTNMKAIEVEGGKGPPSALRVANATKPEPGDGEILIQVRAAGVNRPDVFQRMGLYPPPPGAPDTLGLEVAGEVSVAAGRWKVGDRVCALLGGGGYAEFAVCDARHALPIPDSMSFEQAAGLPETMFTVFANVIEDGRLIEGETLMVHGATSGIGVTAIQLAKAVGAKVIATSRSEAKAASARSVGADVVIDTSAQDFAEVAKAEGGVDVILNMVGGDFFPGDLDSLNVGGRIVFIASLGGNEVTLPILTVMQKNATITGSTMKGRTADEKARLTAELERIVWPMIENGRVDVKVDRTFPLADAAAAHEYLEAGTHVGKVILAVG